MNIYFSGSIKGGNQAKEFYPGIIAELQKYGTVLTEHIGAMVTDPSKNIATTPLGVFESDKNFLDNSDIVIAEISAPSLGVGWELAYAQYEKKLPIFCLHQEDFNPSWMITGNQYIKVLSYKDVEILAQEILPKIFAN